MCEGVSTRNNKTLSLFRYGDSTLSMSLNYLRDIQICVSTMYLHMFFPTVFQGCDDATVHKASVDNDGMVLTVEGDDSPVHVPLKFEEEE